MWKHNAETLSCLGINEKYFISTKPSDIYSDDAWITMICFCVVSFYESKREI